MGECGGLWRESRASVGLWGAIRGDWALGAGGLREDIGCLWGYRGDMESRRVLGGYEAGYGRVWGALEGV